MLCVERPAPRGDQAKNGGVVERYPTARLQHGKLIARSQCVEDIARHHGASNVARDAQRDELGARIERRREAREKRETHARVSSCWQRHDRDWDIRRDYPRDADRIHHGGCLDRAAQRLRREPVRGLCGCTPFGEGDLFSTIDDLRVYRFAIYANGQRAKPGRIRRRRIRG